MPDDIILGDFVRVQGDAWDYEWTTDADCSDILDVLVTVRRGPNSSYGLVADSGSFGGVTITEQTFGPSGGTLGWVVAATHTVVPDDVWIEVQITDAAGPKTEMPATRITVIPQLGS